MNIGKWKSAGYVRIGKRICRLWQYEDSDWYVVIPSSYVNTHQILRELENGVTRLSQR